MTFDWNEVWTRKGKSDSSNHLEISGFEHLQIDSEKVAMNILKRLELTSHETLLEVGCASGLFARHFDIGCRYVGTDKIEAMVQKNIQLNRLSAIRCDAHQLIFKDKAFDKSFSFGVFHYFPNHEYMWQAIDEMTRVTSRVILIADLPRVSHDSNHLLFNEEMFTKKGWTIVEASFFRPERFDILKRLN